MTKQTMPTNSKAPEELCGLTEEEFVEFANAVREIAAAERTAMMDPESIATIRRVRDAHANGQKLEGEADSEFEVDLDVGYEFTLFGFTELNLEQAQATFDWMEDSIPFPGSMNIKPVGDSYWIQRSDERDLPYQGEMGRVRYEEGRLFECLLRSGSKFYRASVVRDPEFDPAAKVIRPLWIHRG